MKFVSIRDFRAKAAAFRRDIETGGEVILTINGKPFALLTPVDPEDFEKDVLAVRRARARRAVERIRAHAKAKGLDKLSTAQVDKIVAKARREGRRDR